MTFSIIIPVYNAEKYLPQALDSVLAQTYADYECICVNDGSTDGSAAILDEYAAKDSRFRVLRQKNAGVSVARNEALKRAQGEYVCFVDADDVVDERWLADYAVAVRATNADIIRINRTGDIDEAGTVPQGELASWLWRVLVNDGYPWAYAARRSVAVKATFPEGVTMSEDAAYLMRLVPHVASAAQLKSCGYHHIVRAGSAMGRSLASADRLQLLQAIDHALGVAPDADSRIMSGFVAGTIMSWMDRPKDVDRKREIRAVWKSLESRGCAGGDGVRLLYRWAYAVYAITGWIWPARTWSELVRRILIVKGRAFRG